MTINKNCTTCVHAVNISLLNNPCTFCKPNGNSFTNYVPKIITDQKKIVADLLTLCTEKQNLQKVLMKKMASEECTDIHSVLRAKGYAHSILELEIQIKTLFDTIILANKD